MSNLVQAIVDYSSHIEELTTNNIEVLKSYVDNHIDSKWFDEAKCRQISFKAMKQYFPFDPEYVKSDVFAENEDIVIHRELKKCINRCSDDIHDMIMNKTYEPNIIHVIKGATCTLNAMDDMVRKFKVQN